MTKAKAFNGNVHIYKNRKGEWAARLIAANNEIVATSEGYKRKIDAVRWREKVLKLLVISELVEHPKGDPRRTK